MKLEKNNHTGDKKHILSKSTFIRGLQCHKSLYLNRYRPELRNEIDPKLQQAFDRGSELGVYAQKLFPGGTDASPETPFKYQESVRNTAELVAGGVPVIYEAAFQYDGVLSAIDILVFKDGEWNAYEVKSSTGVSDTYILDAALQYYVMVNSGIPLRDIFIVHVNNQYIRHGDIDVFSLFMAQSVLGEVLERQEFIAESIVILKQVLKQKQ
ncbi:MAG TPA: DUF2779 domain-containing protein, partial [Bacillota bacterium]|nr:DUF2779 domain-containing protein [Bacillota bacterium]